jgi:transcription elongation factor Elf1
MKCPGCGEKKNFWTLEKKVGIILVKKKLRCRRCGLTFKFFDFKGVRK